MFDGKHSMRETVFDGKHCFTANNITSRLFSNSPFSKGSTRKGEGFFLHFLKILRPLATSFTKEELGAGMVAANILICFFAHLLYCFLVRSVCRQTFIVSLSNYLAMAKSEIGKLGEDLAAQDLVSKGCKIIARNYRQKFGEIDIVARAKDGLLLFIEVKTLIADRGAEMKPEDNMTMDKVRKFKKIAEFYALRYPELVGERGWRADVAAVYLFPDYLTKLKNNFSINYYENIF